MTLQEIAGVLRGWDRVLVISHASPDGDTLGSAAALLRGLQKLGKTVGFACGDPIPEKFCYLFEGLALESFTPSYVVTVDMADPAMLTTLRETYEGRVDLALDHHLAHKPFAKLAYVDAACAANAEIVFDLLQALAVPFDAPMADCIYTGLSTDTGCFRYRNVTAKTHRIAAATIELGAAAGSINQRMFETKTRAQINAELAAMAAIEYHFDNKCALMCITLPLMEAAGITEQDLDPLVARPRQIEGVLIGLTLKERATGGFKASVRTNEPANAAEICLRLGGGGHKGAAGCSLPGDLALAKEKLLAACEDYLKEQGF